MALALPDLTRAVDKNIAHANTFLSRGAVYSQLRLLDKALRDFDTALKTDLTFDRAYLPRGLAFQGMGNDKAAIADFNVAIRLAPQSYLSYYYSDY